MTSAVAPIWDEYKRRRRAFRSAFFLWPLWVIVPGSLIRALLVRLGMDDGLAFFLVAVPAIIYVLVANYRRMTWPCPRCGRPFHVNWGRLYGNAWSRRCVHCGLPLWASHEDEAPT